MPRSSTAVIIDLGNGIYLKEAGWKVPLSIPMKTVDSGLEEFNDSKGRKVQSSYVFFRFESPFVPDEFEEIWGQDGSTIQASSMVRVEVRGVIYRYQLYGISGKNDAKNNKFVSTGPATFFGYIDRDADGIFETLDTGSMGTKLSSWIDDLN